MARSLYAGRLGDTVVSLFQIGTRRVLALPTDATGAPTATILEVYDAPGGTHLTDLMALDPDTLAETTPITAVLVPSDGQIPAFKGPDGYSDDVWLLDPEGNWYRLDVRSAVGPAGPTGPTGPGDVNGPASSVNNRIALFDGTTGKLIKDSGVSLAEKQDFDTDLAGIAALVSAADRMPYATGPGTWDLATLTAFARTLLDDADAATARTTLGAAANILGGNEISVAFPALSGSVGIDASAGSIYYNAADLMGDITLALSNISQAGRGRLVTVYLKHNATLRTVAFSGATLEWQTAIPTGTASKRTTYHFQGLGDGGSTVLAWGSVSS